MKKNNNEYITYLSPEFIFIPFDNVSLLKIKKSKTLFNNLFVGTLNDGTNIFSPVSGIILGVKKMMFSSGEKNTLVVENDFTDKRKDINYKKNISKLKKSEILESLTRYGLNNKPNSKSTLIINSLYNKKYDLKDMAINYEFYEEILEAIDEFMDIFNIKNCYICIDRSDVVSISSYEKYINAFPNICIVNSNKKFKKENNIFYSIEDVLAMHKAIHLDYMYDNTMITINDGKPIIVKVKLYSSLFELLKALKISTKGKKIYIDNVLITNISDYVIDRKVRSVVIKDN